MGVGCDDLYTELWKACAGPLVDVPKAGERVFYFPQGNMEQVCSFFNFPFFSWKKITSLLYFLCFKALRSKSKSLPLLFFGLWILYAVRSINKSRTESANPPVQSST